MPDPFHPTIARPADFDAYWERVLQELDALPIAAEEEEIPLRSTEFCTAYAVRFTGIGPYRLFGYLSVPHGEGPFPALINLARYQSVVEVLPQGQMHRRRGGRQGQGAREMARGRPPRRVLAEARRRDRRGLHGEDEAKGVSGQADNRGAEGGRSRRVCGRGRQRGQGEGGACGGQGDALRGFCPARLFTEGLSREEVHPASHVRAPRSHVGLALQYGVGNRAVLW